jgi:hypothetical protein
MSQPGEWESKLGWLGSFLTGQDAHHVEIANHDSFVAVGWDRKGSSRQAAKFSLEDLTRPWVPYKKSQASSSRSARLGALGREIDRAQLEVASIHEELHGFVVTGSIAGRYENRSFPYVDLKELEAQPADRRDSTADETEEFAAPTRRNSPLMYRLGRMPQ